MRCSLPPILLASALSAVFLVSSPHVATAAEQETQKPNIVFILIDDMGWPDLACYGHAFHETPHIDRLAAEGMKFTDFYAATPVCSSTRSTIQTGQYSARTCITDFIPGHWRPFEKLIVPPIEHGLAEGVQTPAAALKQAGYATAHFGKWHLSPGPHELGYDVTEHTLRSDRNANRAFQAYRATNDAGPKRMDLITDQALWFVESHKDRPLFVTLSHHAVHIPVQAHEPTAAKYEAKPKPDTGVNNPLYAAMIEDLDRTIGRVLDRLETLGLAENTVVVLTSDNGGLRMIYTGVGEVISTNAPLRDEKGTLYEGGIRVPMIVRWPGVVEPGSACDEPTTTADLLPTFCDVAGAALPDQPIDGLSMVPLLRDGGARLAREAIYFHYPHYHHSRPAGAIRAGQYKLIEFFDGEPLELYDLAADIGESKNLAKEMPERAAAMQTQLAAWREAVGARMPTTNPDYDPAKAHQWWRRGKNTPIDVKGMARHYQSKPHATAKAKE